MLFRSEGFDFSFSGLKTAVINHCRSHPDAVLAEVAAAFQEAVVDVLATKLFAAAAAVGVPTVDLSTIGYDPAGAASVPVILEREKGGAWIEEGRATTNSDGRAPDLLPVSFVLTPGTYRISFELADYFRMQNRQTFYPYATITFLVVDPHQHYHVPLLLSGFGFSTYRGS